MQKRYTTRGRFAVPTRRRQRFAQLRKESMGLQAIGLCMVVVGILLTICGASWDPHTGMGGVLWLALIGVIVTFMGALLLQQDVGQGSHER